VAGTPHGLAVTFSRAMVTTKSTNRMSKSRIPQ
jgi:hypothetical protein